MSIKQADTSIYSKAEIIKVINFKHNSTIVDSKDKELLKYLSGICSSDSLSYVKIFAFTDTIGAEKHNDKLAEKRAMLVYKSLGLDKYKTNNCIYVEWLGESAETYDLHFDSAHPQQNCVDIWIMTRKKQNVSRSR
jgi:outer membrane protein OmpA-like peptidoglycan-associated protein